MNILDRARNGTDESAAASLAVLRRLLSDRRWHPRSELAKAVPLRKTRTTELLAAGTAAGLWERVSLETDRWLYRGTGILTVDRPKPPKPNRPPGRPQKPKPSRDTTPAPKSRLRGDEPAIRYTPDEWQRRETARTGLSRRARKRIPGGYGVIPPTRSRPAKDSEPLTLCANGGHEMPEFALTTLEFDKEGNVTQVRRAQRTHPTALAARAAAYEAVQPGWHAHDATDDLLPGVQGWHALVVTLPVLNKVRAVVVSPSYLDEQAAVDVFHAGLTDKAEAELAERHAALRREPNTMTDPNLASMDYAEFMTGYSRASDQFMRDFTARFGVDLDERSWPVNIRTTYYDERRAFEAHWTERQEAWNKARDAT